MLKYLALIGLTCSASLSVAQTNVFPANGNVGIGTITPQSSLNIFKSFSPDNPKSLKMFYKGTWGTVEYASNFRFLDIESTEGGKILQLNGYGLGIGFDPPAYLSSDKLYVNGNVGIGTADPKGYKLSVNGNIRAKEIKVETQNWPDYVFKPDYSLPSLEATEKHIKEKGHLPGIPSAAEAEEKGINLSEMNGKLLKKIEELTLYMIELKKEVKELKTDNQKLKFRGN